MTFRITNHSTHDYYYCNIIFHKSLEYRLPRPSAISASPKIDIAKYVWLPLFGCMVPSLENYDEPP